MYDQEFKSIPEIAIIPDDDLKHVYEFKIANTLRLSENFDILENVQTCYNEFRSKAKQFEDETRRIFKSQSLQQEIFNRPDLYSIGTSWKTFIRNLNHTSKIQGLNDYLQKNNFAYVVAVIIIAQQPANVLKISFFNNQSIQIQTTFENLEIKYKLQFIVLLWIFSLKNTWKEVIECVIILDDFDCFLHEKDLNSLIDVVKEFTTSSELNQIGVKFILTTHCNNYWKLLEVSKKSFLIKKFFKIERKDNKYTFIEKVLSSDSSNKNNHSYIHKFDCVNLEENFNHLKSFKQWKEIPMFSIITGVNGIGKTTLLKYFNSIYSKSFFKSGIEINGEMNSQFMNYFNILNEQLNNILFTDVFIDPYDREVLKKIIREIPLPISLKYYANYHLPILLELVKIEKINKFLKEKNFKWSIKVEENGGGYGVGNFIIKSINQISFIDEKSNVSFNDLSPGERLLLSMYIWEFDLYKDDFIEGTVTKSSAKDIKSSNRYVLLLDEPDVHLHPSKFKHEIVDFLKQTLIENLKIQVIMTTHNPCTIALAQSTDVFCMYSTNGYIEIREASKSHVPPIEQLSSGITIITQQLVLVETDKDRIYFGEICRQLNELASSGNSQFRLFYGEQGQQVRFVCPQFKENDEHEKTKKREKLLDIAKNLEKILTDKFNEYKNSFISSTKEISKTEGEEKLKNQLKRSIPEEKVKKYVENLNRLEKLPNEYFKDIEPNLDPSMIDIVNKMSNFFDKSYEELNPTSPRKTIESLVKQVNYFYNFQSMSRNYTFGLLNGKNASDSENIFIINTDRSSLENYIFDPINLFFILRKEKIKSRKAKDIKRFVNEQIENANLKEALKDNNIDLDNWNQYFNQVKETAKLKVLESLLNLILNVMENFILKEDVIEIEDMSSENQDIEFLQPYNIKLQYNSHILNSNLPMETIKSFFGENDFDLTGENVLSYLIESSYNFLISKEFVNGFRKKFEKLNDLSKKS